MASKLFHPDTWSGKPWMEVIQNLAEALNERLYGCQESSIINLNTERSYQNFLSEISDKLKAYISRYHNHVDGMTPVSASTNFSINDLRWNMTDMLADIGDPSFYDYDGVALGTESYRDMEKVLRQYYEIIIRMKQVIIEASGAFGYYDSFYDPTYDNGIEYYTSINSTSTVSANGSRQFRIRWEGVTATGASSSAGPVGYSWPSEQAQHDTDYSNLYQWFPQRKGPNTTVTDGVYHEMRPLRARFWARAVGNTTTGVKSEQTVEYERWDINIEYIQSRFPLSSLNGLPKKVRFPYHCEVLNGNALGSPFTLGSSDYYDTNLPAGPDPVLNFKFGDNTGRPASIDIAYDSGQGTFNPYNGFTFHNPISFLRFIEEWDDGTDGGFEYYEPSP